MCANIFHHRPGLIRGNREMEREGLSNIIMIIISSELWPLYNYLIKLVDCGGF